MLDKKNSADLGLPEESRTLEEAKLLANAALQRLNLPQARWEVIEGVSGSWERAEIAYGKEQLVLAASGGGVVQVNRNPFSTLDPDAPNVTLERIEASIQSWMDHLKKVNQKNTLAAIKVLPGMTAVCVDGEWRVTINLYRLSERYPDKNTAWCEEKQESMAYYTDDAEDALSTAMDMSERWVAEGKPNDTELTDAQKEALDAFRVSKGRNWKSALRENWERANYPGVSSDHAAALQQLRNTLGPEWLNKYKPSEPKAQTQAPEQEARGRYLFITLDNTQTAAFEDLGHNVEVKRILVETAHRIAVDGVGEGFALTDLNGNEVGRMQWYSDSMIEPLELPPGGVRVGLDMHAPAITMGHDEGMEVCAALLTASSKIGEVGTGTHSLLRNERGVIGALGVGLSPEVDQSPEPDCQALDSGANALEP